MPSMHDWPMIGLGIASVYSLKRQGLRHCTSRRSRERIHSKGVGNDVVIKEIVEDNVVSNSGKDSRLFMLEWPGMGEEEVVSISGKVSRLLILEWPEMGKEDVHANTTKHASTSDVCPVVEPINDENIGYLDCHNEIAGDIHEKVHETLMDDDLFQQDSVVDWQQDPYHVIDEQQKIEEINQTSDNEL
ncbi:hypothetical protein Tco_0238195 [Tanacetum coccineum]